MSSGKPSGPTSLSSSNFGETFRPFPSPSPGLPFASSLRVPPIVLVFEPPAKVLRERKWLVSQIVILVVLVEVLASTFDRAVGGVGVAYFWGRS